MWRWSRQDRYLTTRPGTRRAQAWLANRQLLAPSEGRWALRRGSGGGVVVARITDSADLGGISQSNLDVVVDACEELGVDYFLVPRAHATRRRVGVDSRDRQRVLAALAPADRAGVLYASPLAGRRFLPPRRLHAALGSRGVQQATVLRVFQPHTDRRGRLVVGASHACDLEFWTEDASGALAAPVANPVAAVLPAELRQPGKTEVRGRLYATLVPFTRTLIDEVTFPVDVVYTWVDGRDPAWLARKNAALARRGLGELNEEAANLARYLSRDELKYSLRSLEMHADWVRRVFLVTDDQVPAWLDVDHPRLTVVSHRELFGGSGTLPTFNSHAIESRLHHIDGLAEHYLYLNDDVMLGRTVSPSLFFHANGMSKFFLSKVQVELGAVSVADPPVLSSAKNNRDLLERSHGRLMVQKFKHVPHAARRSVMFEMEERFAAEFARTAAAQFRSPTDISAASSLHHYYAYVTGRAVPGEIRYDYVDLASDTAPARLRRWLANRTFDAFCLNDTTSDGTGLVDRLQVLVEFLETYYPLASSYERLPDAGAGTMPGRR